MGGSASATSCQLFSCNTAPAGVACPIGCEKTTGNLWRTRCLPCRWRVVFLQHCTGRSGVPNRLRPFPAPTGTGVGGVPAPVERCCINTLRRLGNIVLISDRLWRGQYLNALLFFHFPCWIGVGYPLRLAFSVKKKSRTIADLGQRSKHAKIPDRGGQNVSPRTQERRDVIGLISPMTQVASR